LTTFHRIHCFELLQLNCSVLPQLKHETTKDLNQFQTHPSISTSHTKGEKSIVDLVSASLVHSRATVGLGMVAWKIPSSPTWWSKLHIYNIHSLGVTRIVRDKVVDVARWGTQNLYNTDTSDVNKLQSRPLPSEFS